jgi:hypothetical protein
MTQTRAFQGVYNGLRSYNRDMTVANRDAVNLSAFNSDIYQGAVTFDALEAGKDYVVARASLTHGETTITSARGVEGVFRTVIALSNIGATFNGNDQNNTARTFDLTTVGANRAVFVQGSNIKNGMPSIAGFPVRDAEETGDNRYIKMFYRNAANNSNAQLLWVSTEIVSEWYFLKWGGRHNDSTHMQDGETNNYMMVGYGDLTYGYAVRSYNDNRWN